MTVAFERQVLAQPLADYADAQALAVSWPNKTFNKPFDPTTNKPLGWVRFTVLDAKAQQIEMGSPASNTNRVYGSLILQIFAPADEGDGKALALADVLGKLYRQQVLNFPDVSGLVRMRNPLVKAIGNTDAYYQVNVVIPFHRDDL